MKENNGTERRCYVKILFYKESRYSALAETVYYKNDMDIDFFMRWKWYFQYRGALLRVQNPHAYIELSHGSYEYELPEDKYRRKVYNLLLAAKRKLTQYLRQIEYVKVNWDELFPMEEHPKWIKVQAKLTYYEERVQVLSKEYEEIQPQSI